MNCTPLLPKTVGHLFDLCSDGSQRSVRVSARYLRQGAAQCRQLLRGVLPQLRAGPGLPHSLALHRQSVMDGLERHVNCSKRFSFVHLCDVYVTLFILFKFRFVLSDHLHPTYKDASLYKYCTIDFANTPRTPLGSSKNFLVKLLGLRRSDLRAGQLGVDIVRDGPHRGRQSAAAAAHVAGRQLGQRELKLDA